MRVLLARLSRWYSSDLEPMEVAEDDRRKMTDEDSAEIVVLRRLWRHSK